MKLILDALFVAFLATSITAWNGDNLIKWDTNCRWYGHISIASKSSRAEQCGEVCVATRGCKVFNWSRGTCWMYPATVEARYENG